MRSTDGHPPPASVGTAVTGEAAIDARGDRPWPTVDVAVLAFNRRDKLRLTLRKVLDDLRYEPGALRVIVVDSASTDGTAEMLAAEFPSVRVVRLERNVGVSGWNAAFDLVDAGWCLVLDDDCWIDGRALELAVAAAERNDADLVSFHVRAEEPADYLFTEDENESGLLCFWGCAALLSRRALERLGGFDPFIFVGSHELEFTIRLLDAGLRHLFLPEVVAVHMKAPTRTAALDHQLVAHRNNYRQWAHAATKLLRPADAARVLGRLALGVAIDVYARGPGAARTLPVLVEGAIGGLRTRHPVRPEVSAAYRDNFVSFANPVRFLRSPLERVTARRSEPELRRLSAAARWEEFRRARSRFFPRDTALIDL